MLIVVSASEHLHVWGRSRQQSAVMSPGRRSTAALQHCSTAGRVNVQQQCPAPAATSTCSKVTDGLLQAACCMCRVMYCPCSHCSAAAAGGRGGPGTGRGHECCSQHSCGLPTFCSTRSGVRTLRMETSVSFRDPKLF